MAERDPRWSNDRLREACLLRCGMDGDPACFEMNGSGPADAPYNNSPCDDCLRDCGIELAEPIDPNAAVRDMFS